MPQPSFAEVGRNKETKSDTPVFQANTQLVIETVVVKDKNGNPVTGLKASDFTVTEDGAPQTVEFFGFLQLASNPQVRSGFRNGAGRAVSAPAAFADCSRGPRRCTDRRLLALYFDLTAMPPPDQYLALNAAKRFVRTQMSAADLVAVMAFSSGSVQVLQDFTDNRGRLLNVIETLIVGEDENAPIDDSTRADTGAAFGQNDSEFSIFFTDRQLAALQTAATMLGRLNEKKALVYFASGLRLNGANNQAQLHATINAAIRAGVSFWPVDARGLVAQAPLGDATTGSPGGVAAYSGVVANAVTNGLQRSQDTLWTLAADTGRQSPARQQRTVAGHRPGPESYGKLLHSRLLHDQREPGWQVPQDQDRSQSGRGCDARIPSGLPRNLRNPCSLS